MIDFQYLKTSLRAFILRLCMTIGILSLRLALRLRDHNHHALNYVETGVSLSAEEWRIAMDALGDGIVSSFAEANRLKGAGQEGHARIMDDRALRFTRVRRQFEDAILGDSGYFSPREDR